MNLDDLPFDKLADQIGSPSLFAVSLLNCFDEGKGIYHENTKSVSFDDNGKVIHIKTITFIMKHSKCDELEETLLSILRSFRRLDIKTPIFTIGTTLSGDDGDHDDSIKLVVRQ